MLLHDWDNVWQDDPWNNGELEDPDFSEIDRKAKEYEDNATDDDELSL